MIESPGHIELNQVDGRVNDHRYLNDFYDPYDLVTQ
jgi:hypothetical protein